MLEFFPERFAVWESLRVGHQARAHRAHRLVFTAPFFDGELAMALNQLPFFGNARRRKVFACGEIMFYLAENPGRAHRGAADHRAGDAGFGAAPDRVLTTR